MKPLHTEILRALLYYDIFHHPLTTFELFSFLPMNSMTFEEFTENIKAHGPGSDVHADGDYYFVRGKSAAIVTHRGTKERHARKMWKRARLSMHVIKRFPFVRGVFVSGDLSKNATNKNSDVDFFILTEPNHLWITRTLLILFKKFFLLNSKKYFCLNYFATTDHLALGDQNIFLATEVAHLKPLYNSELFFSYIEANKWILVYFPNLEVQRLAPRQISNRRSILQRLLEIPFSLVDADTLDSFLMRKMKEVWKRRYPEYDEATRERLFRCTKYESRAYVGNFEEKILALYHEKLREFGIAN
jgi:hypothetical protein